MSASGEYSGKRCVVLGGSFKLCVGDYVMVALRTRSYPNTIEGKVTDIGPGTLTLEDGESTAFIYLREVKAIIRKGERG